MKQHHRTLACVLALSTALLTLMPPRALADAAPLSVHPVTNWDRLGIRQADGFVFFATAGTLQVQIDLTDGSTFMVGVAGPTPDKTLFQGILTSASPTVEITLPETGDYQLMLSPFIATQTLPTRSITVTAPGLQMKQLTTPGLRLPEMALYSTQNQPFEVTPSIEPGTTAGSLEILLDEQPLHENIMQPDGTIAPARIDPSTLQDGIHRLMAVAQSADSENTGSRMQIFFVDRVDAFADVSAGHWARKPVELMHDLGIINGVGEGRFAPAEKVTRAQFAKMLALTLHFPLPSSPATQFADIPQDHWAAPYLQVLYERGLMKGEVIDGQTFMQPDRTITRAEATTLLGRALGVADQTLSANELAGAADRLSDLATVPSWAQSSVVILHQLGWITGFPDATFRPSELLQRDQAARILSRFLGI